MPPKPKKREVRWKEVSRRRLEGKIRISYGVVRVFYEVFQKRTVNRKTEFRQFEDSRIVRYEVLQHYLLAETVARLLPFIEGEVFTKVESEMGLCFDGYDLVPEQKTPLAKALLGRDPF